jgi:hypothetical protein
MTAAGCSGLICTPAAVIYGGRTVGSRRPNVERLQLDPAPVFASAHDHAVPA